LEDQFEGGGGEAQLYGGTDNGQRVLEVKAKPQWDLDLLIRSSAF
jgi:hypothetical protein